MSTKQRQLFIALYFIFAGCFLMQTQAQETCENLEKIYAQTDRSFYFPGETIWFKSYIVGADNTISTYNDVMYATLISPKGSTIATLKLGIHHGYAYGDFTIDDNWVGGIYTLKMYTNWMRNFGEEAFFTKKITVQKIVKPNVLLSLDFEKKGYGKATNVTANFEAKDLKNNPITQTELSYEVTVKGVKIVSKNSTTDAQGKSKLTFQLPTNTNTRDVVLNVMLTHNGTTESISRSVPMVLDMVDLQFFPESGKLLSGTENNVAFKAVDEFGKPVDVSGIIVNEKGNRVATFDSFHDGMGALTLQAKKNEAYFAVIKTPFEALEKIALPKVHQNGVNFRVKTDSVSTEIYVHSTLNRQLSLEIANASTLLSTQAIAANQKIVKVNTSKFPIGITKFKIVDINGTPLAERLVFLNPKKQLQVDIKLEKETYLTREKVKVSITTKDEDHHPIPSNLSVAVVDNKLLSYADDKQHHILTSLLLSSELKGKIHEPDFYFNPKKEKSYAALDYIMLTHGWRDYVEKPILDTNAVYPREKFAVQRGKVVDLKGNPVQAKLLLFDNKSDKAMVFNSNANGTFSFTYGDSNYLTLLAYAEDGRHLKIIEHEKIISTVAKTPTQNRTEKSNAENEVSKFNKPTEKKIKKNANVAVTMATDNSNLDEVTVVAYGTTAQSKAAGSCVMVIGTEEITQNENIGRLLQGNVAGIKVINTAGIYGNRAAISIRGRTSITGNSEPLFVVDGVPYDGTVLTKLDSNDIQSISVLKNSAATALYGSSGANGVILIKTNTQNFYNNYGKKKIKQKRFNNYAFKIFTHNKPSQLHVAKKFYIPKYDNKEISEERTDFRQTIYWNPIVETDEKGSVSFEFFNSDAVTSFQILVEGIGYNGLVGRQKKNYATKKLLHVDFKSPNYMVLNDEVRLPVTITNETNVEIETKLKVQLPEFLQLLEAYDEKITVKANSAVVTYVTVKPIAKTQKAMLQIDTEANGLSDTIKKEVTILSPYFPTEVSVSGTTSESYQFRLDNVVSGSLQAEFSIYTDVIGEVMDGVEGLIQKPYGCFEQTSSATYPNIMVLKYLKETNKSNPEIEAKALKFIEEGYKRLVGFETKEGGFEWFGNTPPHETLTAYGILEFTEMKEVYNGVSQKMIDRTVKWLLDRRDGKGGFNRSNRGYDSFASAPDAVANAYIVYALSESGVAVNLKKEYQVAYADALPSEDAYKMALMACASYNLGKKEHAEQLIVRIKQQIAHNGYDKLPVENTITRSYANSKSIETAAFTILALLKETQPDEVLISKGIKYILSKRKNGRFGATQATATALKALIEYTKIQKTKLISNSDTVTLQLNGKELKSNLKTSNNGKIILENIDTYFGKGIQNVRVQFSNPKITFPYSLHVYYDSSLPESSKTAPIQLQTNLANKTYNVGDNVSCTINVSNTNNEQVGMVTAIIGVPSGTTPQSWQLKKLVEEQEVAYYEIFDNYLVFYWRSMQANATNTIRLDLKAEVPGNYTAPASTAYLYYGDELKTWTQGNTVRIKK